MKATLRLECGDNYEICNLMMSHSINCLWLFYAIDLLCRFGGKFMRALLRALASSDFQSLLRLFVIYRLIIRCSATN